MRLSHQKNMRMFNSEKIKDGDYVYAPDMQGVYFVSEGLISASILLLLEERGHYFGVRQ